MILDSGAPIDLSRILLLIRLSAELRYIDLPVGTSAFDHPTAVAAIDEAVADFPGMIEDNVEHEQEIRRGLCWLLHQDDEFLLGVYRTGLDLTLASPSMADQRRFLELLWASGFADWRTKPLDPDLYGVLDPDADGDLPVVRDAIIPIDFSVIVGLLRSSAADDVDGLLVPITDQPEREHDARLGLWWLLHQDDDVLAALLERGGMTVAGGSIEGARRLLERLWDRVFADWRVPGFDPADHEVVGLPV